VWTISRIKGRYVEITERPQAGAKKLPNVVKITSLEWHARIKGAPQRAG